jgi:phenylacetate-CoA ligase
LVIASSSQKAPFWVWNATLRQLYMSANHISAQNVPAYLDAINRYRLTHILAYSSAAAALARGAMDKELRFPHLRVVLTIAEPLLPRQLEDMVNGFRCQVRQTYGMSELVAAASECSAGTLHLWPEVGHLEVLKESEDTPAPPGTLGRVIATGLLNSDMPLIRYNLGDRAALKQRDQACSCGRQLPALMEVEGRNDDLLYARAGRVFGRLDPVFKARLPIVEAQIIQETLDRVRIRYVPGVGFATASARDIVERLQARMGPVEVIMEQLSEVPRDRNGKFRAVICNLSETERKNVPGPPAHS